VSCLIVLLGWVVVGWYAGGKAAGLVMVVKLMMTAAPHAAAACRTPLLINQSHALLHRGLSRIDQRALPADARYSYPPAAGNGTTVYVIDTGVDPTHPDFEGRVTWGADVTKDATKGLEDKAGHGTHCAGTVAGKTVGVAKAARVVGVKVLHGANGAGNWGDVIEGINWAVNDCLVNRGGRMCILSMSLGGKKKRAVNEVVEAAVAAGLVVAVAAGGG